MCTVSYLPLSQDEFVLTSNRDESPKRSPLGLEFDGDGSLLLPREPQKGGTWICAAQTNRLVCLLNGAFDRHKHEPPYSKSRGIVVLDFFKYKEATAFFRDYDLDGVEPFTMVIYDNGDLYEFRWDETTKHMKALDRQQPYIWSSSTLYTAEVKQMRQEWFADWRKTQPQTAESILNFHQTAGIGDKENDLIMERYDGILKTVSITTVKRKTDHFEMTYNDLIHQERFTQQLPINA
ncbi:MAG: hypothetical protein GY810_30340 [Aureispira sp.]|nr:hypothetical protein [Aureispira sp.]